MPIHQVQLTLPRPHPGQRGVLREARRYNTVACGRRWGKSTMAIELLTRPALEAQPVGYFAPTYKLLTELWRWLEVTLHPVMRRSNATDRRIELVTGGVIECWTLEDSNAGRSRKYARVVIDEAGLVPTLGETWQAAIRPTLADMQGDAWMLGTPKGRNFFWECWMRGLDETRTDWMSWQKPTSDNPHIKPEEIEAMRFEMTERRFEQEILATFLDDGGGVFRNVREAATAQPGAEPDAAHAYVIGCDWGKSNDYTCFAVIDVTDKKMVFLDRSNKVDYILQRARLLALCERWKPGVVIAEANAMGTPIIEALSRDRIPVRAFTTTNATKAVIIDALSLAFERRDITILNDPTLIAELQAYESERLPSGLTRYSAPESMHDDTVMALALAWSALGRGNSAVGAFG